MASLSARVRISVSLIQSGDNDFGGQSFSPVFERELAFDNGTGAGQANVAWLDHRTLAAAGNDDLDLRGAALLDFQGVAAVFAEICALIVFADAGNDAALNLGAGTNPITSLWLATGDGAKVPPGGFVALARRDDPAFATVAATGDILRINNPGAITNGYDICVIGRTA